MPKVGGRRSSSERTTRPATVRAPRKTKRARQPASAERSRFSEGSAPRAVAAESAAPSPPALPIGARVLAGLDAHAKQVGYPFAVVASPSGLLLDDGAHEVVDASTGRSFLPLSVAALHAQGNLVVPWAPNTRAEMERLVRLGVDGFVTDEPDVARQVVEALRASDIGADGRIDPSRFSLQAHRGGRGLRPENTLPAMEVGLDNLVNTLESDVNLTRDGVPVLNHENAIDARNARRTDGGAYERSSEVLVKELTLAEHRSRFVLDKLLPERPRQTNDRALSPVAVAFARERGLPDAYALATVGDLFAFTRFYADYYRSGPGRSHPDAERRAKNAEQVRFNLETKVVPSAERAGRSTKVGPLTAALAGAIEAEHLESRVTIESFDSRSLRIVQREHPAIGVVYLFDGKTEEPAADELVTAS